MITCPSCDRFLVNSANNCPCGWVRDAKAQARRYYEQPEAKSGPLCGHCRAPLTGAWTNSPKGRVCDPCWRAYMAGAWPLDYVNSAG